MKTFFSRKRNLAAVLLFAVLLLAHTAGIIMSACFEHAGTIGHGEFLHRLLYYFVGFLLIGGIFLVEAVFRVRFPFFLEIAVMVFAFAGNTLATIYGFHDLVPHWDKVLHFTSGALFSCVGFCLAQFLFGDRLTGLRKTLAFCLFAFFFALVVGYLWEIYEFLCDTLVGTDFQRWSHGIVEDLGNDTYIVSDKRGTAILDTMVDMSLNAACALVCCAVTFFVAWKKENALDVFLSERIPKKQKQ